MTVRHLYNCIRIVLEGPPWGKSGGIVSRAPERNFEISGTRLNPCYAEVRAFSDQRKVAPDSVRHRVAASITFPDVMGPLKLVYWSHAYLAYDRRQNHVAFETNAGIFDSVHPDHESRHRPAIILHGLAKDAASFNPDFRTRRNRPAVNMRKSLIGVHVTVENKLPSTTVALQDSYRVRASFTQILLKGVKSLRAKPVFHIIRDRLLVSRWSGYACQFHR